MSHVQRKRSPVWNHFSESEPKKAKCVYCGQVLSMPSGNIGNLGRHLKMKHPSVSQTVERQRSDLVTDENVQLCQQNVESPDQASSSQSLAPVFASTSTQPRITEFTQFAKPLPLSRAQKIDNQLLIMIATEYHPLSLVEDTEFKKFVSMLCPGYSLPTRKTLSNSILPKLYAKILESAKAKIEDARAVCLTTDGWTSMNNESFIAVTAHFITNSNIKIELESVLMGCIQYDDRHTSTKSEFKKNIISEWRLESKVTAIASDNAVNITAAIRQEGWRQIPCFAHIINLCVKTCLMNIATTTNKVKAIVEFFKRSPHALAKFSDMQKQLGLNPLKLKQDVSTRWNSMYEMLSRLIASKDVVVATMKNELSLTDRDWSIIDQAIPILELFYNVTVEISAEKNVTLSKVIPLCNIMFRHTKSHLRRADYLDEIMLLVNTLDKELYKRFGSIELNFLCSEATILDPRFKQKGFADTQRFEKAATDLKQKVSRMARIIPLVTSVPESHESLPSTSQNSGSIWENFDAEVSLLTPTNPVAAAILEFDKYMQEPLLLRTRDPLVWWYERRYIYPMLYDYIMTRLHLVATSVPCERIFLKAGYTLSERRTRLQAKKLSQLLFISNNTHLC